MSKFIRNPEGAIHSVPDDWSVPLGADDKPQEGWAEVPIEDVPANLLGSSSGVQLDPDVHTNELHNLGTVDDPTNPDATGIPDIPSSGHVGDDPTVDENIEAAQVPAQAGVEVAQ